MHEQPEPAVNEPRFESSTIQPEHHRHVPATPPPPLTPPDEPPPSYEDATRLESAPLLVGPPPDYGAFRAYGDPDGSSVASSEVEPAERSLAEYLGQAMVVAVFVGIIYLFWTVIDGSDVEQPPW